MLGTYQTAWRNEYLPSSIRILAITLTAYLDLRPGAYVERCTARGGYHRSAAWVGAYGPPDDRSVTHRDDQGGDPNWMCALDVAMDRTRLLLLDDRLEVAMRDGALPHVADHGDRDGWLHVGFRRRYAAADHDDVLAVLLA